MAKSNDRPGGMDNLSMGPKTGFRTKSKPSGSGDNAVTNLGRVAGGRIEGMAPNKGPKLPVSGSGTSKGKK